MCVRDMETGINELPTSSGEWDETGMYKMTPILGIHTFPSTAMNMIEPVSLHDLLLTNHPLYNCSIILPLILFTFIHLVLYKK